MDFGKQDKYVIFSGCKPVDIIHIRASIDTVYPTKYAQVLCFDLLCCALEKAHITHWGNHGELQIPKMCKSL